MENGMIDACCKARPACFTAAQWQEWYEHCAHLVNPIDFACVDCTPQFKERMMRAGKCDWPCVEFFKVGEDENIEGRRMSIEEGRGKGYDIGIPVKSI